jgi:tetratricopeptide (TPR) repeat protein
VVRSISPARLLGRDAELAEMQAFCEGPEHHWWWRADAWAGKSALMSWFVLNPAPGTVVVSFFVRSDQADSDAFTAALVSQLEELLGPELPLAATADGLADRYVLLLSEAARYTRRRGKRLVLVVDGLDEDRGPLPGLPSIASLLPRDGEDGLKVIVASRSSRGLPPDVLAGHPLHDPYLARTLRPWRHAEEIRAAAQHELHELLNGTRFQQDLLGLLTAARGGLTPADLAELTGQARAEVGQALAGMSDPTLGSRAVEVLPDEVSGRVYVLAHETLQGAAADALGEQRVSGYRDRLYSWADAYRSSRWPVGTPVYLLASYFGMLDAAGDLSRLIACASDQARHDRMLAVTGGDAAALAEIATATNRLLSQPDPDLATLAHLAAHRDDLARRNEHIPPDLPVVWVAAGEPARAEALARAITDLGTRASALTRVAAALPAAGLPDRAEILARLIADPSRQAYALAEVAQALAAAGFDDRARQVAGRAEYVARSITGADSRASALTQVAVAMAAVGRPDQAENIANSVSDPRLQVAALTSLADTLAAAGLNDRAGRLVGRAGSLAEEITDPSNQAGALAQVAQALAGAGQTDQARQAARRAETLVRSVIGPGERAGFSFALPGVTEALAAAALPERAEALARSIAKSNQLAEVLGALAGAGYPDRAEVVARSITEPARRAEALARVARALAATGHLARAGQVALEAETAASDADPGRRDPEMAKAAAALAAAGRYDRAEAIAHAITGKYWQVRALTEVSAALAAAGHAKQAGQVAGQAENAARSTTSPGQLTRVLVGLAGALAAAGLTQRARQAALRAEAAARSITHPTERADALVIVAETLATAGLYDQAENLASSIAGPGRAYAARAAEALARVTKALAAAGQVQRARQVARRTETFNVSMSNWHKLTRVPAATRHREFDRSLEESLQAGALGAVAKALAAAGQLRQAQRTARQAETLARSVVRRGVLFQSGALAGALEALAAAGMHDRAQALGRTIVIAPDHPDELAQLAQALAAAGLYDQAETVGRSITSPDQRGRALAGVAEALATAGHYDQAETLAHSITSADHRAQALAGVAEALAAAGHMVPARRLFARALSTGPRMVPLRKHVLPASALEAVADLLLRPDAVSPA